MSTPTTTAAVQSANRHALTAVEKQRVQLERLLKDPAKPAYVPPPLKEKTIRPPREMMKNVQGSSAGAGSGEFHVYKASRRREYERLKLLEETAQKEITGAEFEQKRRELDELAEAKTAKNRAKRQKKKGKGKAGGGEDRLDLPSAQDDTSNSGPLKKRRLVNGTQLIFRQPGEDEDEDKYPPSTSTAPGLQSSMKTDVAIHEVMQFVELPKIIIHED